jgi:hypothetical protein
MGKRRFVGALVLAAAAVAFGLEGGCDAPDEKTVRDATGTATVCEVHGVPLREDVVAVSFGKPAYYPESEEARRKEFPHARTSCHGGCMVQEPTRARVRYCPECRKAEAAWRAHNPGK